MKAQKLKKAVYTLQKEISALKAEIQELENVREEVLPDISELEENRRVRSRLARYLNDFFVNSLF